MHRALLLLLLAQPLATRHFTTAFYSTHNIRVSGKPLVVSQSSPIIRHHNTAIRTTTIIHPPRNIHRDISTTELHLFAGLFTSIRSRKKKIFRKVKKNEHNGKQYNKNEEDAKHVMVRLTHDEINRDINITNMEGSNGKTLPKEIDDDQIEIGNFELTTSNHRRMWMRRGAKSVEDGIRRKKWSSSLSSLLQSDVEDKPNERSHRRKLKLKYGARTIAGLIVALAEEAENLEVEVNARHDTPLWDKHVDSVKINFSRLGFKPLRVGGLSRALTDLERMPEDDKLEISRNSSKTSTPTVDEAFKRIDVDNSGLLDKDEIISALNMAMGSAHGDQMTLTSRSKELVKKFATKLVNLYDANGDQGLDRKEYQMMVEDMAELRRSKRRKHLQEVLSDKRRRNHWWNRIPLLNRNKDRNGENLNVENVKIAGVDGSQVDLESPSGSTSAALKNPSAESMIDFSKDEALMSSFRGEGSIVLSDMKLDLRRLLFGAVPLVKTVSPGGPLVLEPFTAKVTGSFDKHDMMDSFLLDAGLRRLVERVLQKRVRGIRDLADGAVFFGRTWNMACKTAPMVEVPKLTSIEFDKNNKAIITGRARVRSSPDAPVIENSFKLRTKIGAWSNGQRIGLDEPELALVAECPEAWEKNIVSACTNFKLPIPTKPDPLYTYFPLLTNSGPKDTQGFYLGEDNCIKSIYINNGALHFEFSAVLRPGRFLGNHYIAFSVPNRTFIITMDRVKEGIRAARRNKLALEKAAKAAAKEGTSTGARESKMRFKDHEHKPELKGRTATDNKEVKGAFLSRFVTGFMSAAEAARNARDEALNERLTAAVSEWFGRQDLNDEDEIIDMMEDEIIP